MRTEKKKKKSWFKNQVTKVQILPWYWKIVITLVLFFAGGSLGMQMYTASSDFTMMLGFIVLALVVWVLFQMWLPTSKK